MDRPKKTAEEGFAELFLVLEDAAAPATPEELDKLGQILDDCKRLQAAGFVHITGLPIFSAYCATAEPTPCQANRLDCGKWDCNNGYTVIVTQKGEIWLRRGPLEGIEHFQDIFPRGKGCNVPCSNGDHLEAEHLLERTRNPFADFNGEFLAEPFPTD